MSGSAQQLAPEFCSPRPDGEPGLQKWQQHLFKTSVATEQPPNLGFEPASFCTWDDQTECLHHTPDLIGQFSRNPDKAPSSCNQRADQHTVVALHANLAVEADLGEMGQAVGVIGVGLVRCHVQRRLGMSCIDADGRKPFGAQRMVKPDGQRAGLEHDPPCIRCAPLQNHSNRLRI